MAKLSYYLLLLIVGIGFVLVVRDTYVDIAVYKKGDIVKAKIEKVVCNKRNSNLDLSFMNANHFIIVPYSNCIKGKYQVGDSITVRVLPEYRRTQFPNSNAFGVGAFLIVIVFIMLITWVVKRKAIILQLSGKEN
ncbi:MAG: hypothetical protein IPM47_20440 [Sphingobacteriales bacterium]|nr:MAG: hypothetical protein IPM47_20440 [Sphingobacteriales bacterium]